MFNNLEKGSLFLYITFLDSLWNYNIKLLTIILLAFTIPFSAYGQDIGVDKGFFGCVLGGNLPPRQPIQIGLTGGINFSEIYSDEINTESGLSKQFLLYFEYPLSLGKVQEDYLSLSSGIGYNNINLNISDSNHIESKSNLTYITIPVLYQITALTLGEEHQFRTNLKFGSSFNIFVSQSSNEVIENPNWIYLGAILGAKIEYALDSNLALFVDYHIDIAITDIQDNSDLDRISSHFINLGLKVPITVF
jgi:hypothetical protein